MANANGTSTGGTGGGDTAAGVNSILGGGAAGGSEADKAKVDGAGAGSDQNAGGDKAAADKAAAEKAAADKGGGDKAAADKAAADKAAAEKAAAPVEYKLNFAEGLKVDEAMVKDFTAIAKESGLKPEAAQKMADLYANTRAAEAKRAVAEFEQTQTKWAEELKADKEIGGQHFDANVKHAQKAMERFGSPELKAYLAESGLGNHPGLVRAFAKMGKAIAEDSLAGTTRGGGDEKSADAELRRLYPSMFSAA